VVQKRVVPREELVVRKREVQEREVVEADLRRERIDVNRDGDARGEAR
jgi:stress response protein YsnF